MQVVWLEEGTRGIMLGRGAQSAWTGRDRRGFIDVERPEPT